MLKRQTIKLNGYYSVIDSYRIILKQYMSFNS